MHMAKSSFTVHPDAQLAAKILLGGGGGKKDASKVEAPKNYRPSTPEQRNNWNKFLDFMASKGMGGNPELDKRDKTRGLEILNEYNSLNPSAKVTPDFIPIAQYESHLIRRQQTFPGLQPEQSKYAFAKLAPQFLNKPLSPVDNWLGSYTSKQYYPTYERAEEGKPKISFGTDFETYTKTVPK